jgi:hypothetical protein
MYVQFLLNWFIGIVVKMCGTSVNSVEQDYSFFLTGFLELKPDVAW